MILFKLLINNFRSLSNKQLVDLTRLVCFIGNNGTGKTVVIDALRILLDYKRDKISLCKQDFYNIPDTSSNDELFIEAIFKLEKRDYYKNSNFYPYIVNDKSDKYLRIRLVANLYLDENNQVNVYQKYYFVVSLLSNDDKLVEDNLVIQNFIDNIDLVYVNNTSIDRELENISKEIFLMNSLLSTCKQKHVYKVVQDKFKSYNNIIDPEFLFSPEMKEIELDSNIKMLGHGLRSLFYFSMMETVLELQNTYSINKLDNIDLKKDNVPDSCSLVFDKLPYLTILVMEEPENGRSPHVIGKLINRLIEISQYINCQVILTTHSTAVIRRIYPDKLRFFSLDNKSTVIKRMSLPSNIDELKQYKYERQFIMIDPEVYFAKLVVLVEGESEFMILRKFFKELDMNLDEMGISLIQLNGVGNVNLFWKILSELGVKYITILDLDSSTKEGGLNRLNNVIEQLKTLQKMQPIINCDIYKKFVKYKNSLYDKDKLIKILIESYHYNFPDRKQITLEVLKKAILYSMNSKKRNFYADKFILEFYDYKTNTFLPKLNNLFILDDSFIQEFMNLLAEKSNLLFASPLDIDYLMVDNYYDIYFNIFSLHFPEEARDFIKFNVSRSKIVYHIYKKLFRKNKPLMHYKALLKFNYDDYRNKAPKLLQDLFSMINENIE